MNAVFPLPTGPFLALMYGVSPYISSNIFLGWRDGPASKVLALQAQGPEFNTCHLY